MPLAHVLAGVVVGAAEGHGQEGLLLGRLLLHIHAFEKLIDAVVGQHLAIENVHRGIHRRLAADAVIQAGLLRRRAGIICR